MVINVNKQDIVHVDGVITDITDINETFLNKLFLSLLKKESSIEVEDEEKCGYIGKLFLELKSACDESSDFYKAYNEIRNQYQEIQENEKKLIDKSENPF